MSFPSLEFNQKRWNRLLLKSFWAMFFLSIIVECLFLFVTEVPAGEFVKLYIVRPTVLMALVVLLAECGVRWLSRHHDFILISASAMLAIIVTAIHSSLEYLLFVLFFPIMISIFYFQFKKLMYAIANTGIALFFLYFSDSEIRANVSPFGLLAVTSILLIYSGISFGVLARGREVLMHLRTSYESNQELLVRNILMDKLAKTDALTDTFNHMAYHEFMEKLVEQAENGTVGMHLALFDIDNFKSVNDSYGHRAGDAVLKKVAAIARSKAGSNDVVSRYGGEEFAIVFTDKTFEEAYDLAEELRVAVATAPHEPLKGLSVTISIGLNQYAPGMGKEAFFQGADSALYEAKHTGKNRTALSASLNWKISHLA